MKEKYIVFNIAECKKFLPIETVNYLAQLITFMDAERVKQIDAAHQAAVTKENERAVAESRPPVPIERPASEPPLYWTLNMKDKHALPALEHYIDRMAEDSEAKGHRGARDSMSAAMEIRNRSKFLDTKLPD